MFKIKVLAQSAGIPAKNVNGIVPDTQIADSHIDQRGYSHRCVDRTSLERNY